jgi:hypothetical protein
MNKSESKTPELVSSENYSNTSAIDHAEIEIEDIE